MRVNGPCGTLSHNNVREDRAMTSPRSQTQHQKAEPALALSSRDQNEPGPVAGGGLLGDDAIVAAGSDRLGRAAFAGRLVELVGGIADQTHSAVIGLIGAWGSGKTSVLHLVRAELRQDDAWEVVDFNPWVVSDVPGLTASSWRQ